MLLSLMNKGRDVMMLKRFSFLLFTFAFFSYVVPVKASQSLVTGHDFKTHCFSPYDTDSGYCAGYVTAVADLMIEHRLYGFEACNIGFIRSQQFVDTVRLYMKKHPESLNSNARLIVAQAIAKAFPCY